MTVEFLQFTHKIGDFLKEFHFKKGGKARATAVTGGTCNSTCMHFSEMDFQKEMRGFFMHSVVSNSPPSLPTIVCFFYNA